MKIHVLIHLFLVTKSAIYCLHTKHSSFAFQSP